VSEQNQDEPNKSLFGALQAPAILEISDKEERKLLFERAKSLGLRHSNNISTAKLREMVNAKMEGAEVEEQDGDDPADEDARVQELQAEIARLQAEAAEKKAAPAASDEVNALTGQSPAPKTLTPNQRKALRRREKQLDSLKLIRLRITNLNPNKKDLPGEIITVANDLIGVVRKYIPYGEHSENGYHVPNILYKFMKRRQFQDIREVKKNGQDTVVRRLVKEFALEVLPPLTEEELNLLKAAQAAHGNIG